MTDGPTQSDGRLESLLALWLDHQLSEAEWSELRAILVSNPAAMDVYLDHVNMHALLEVELGWQGAIQNQGIDLLAQVNPQAAITASLNDAMILPAISEDLEDDLGLEPFVLPPSAPAKSGGPRLKSRRAWLLAASCLLALSIAIIIAYTTLRHRPPGVNIATLTGTIDARWDAATGNWNSGDILPTGQKLSLASGWAQLTYSNGVVATIEGPARFSADQGGLVWLDSGKLTATVPEAGHGFTVKTASATIVDLGTEFGVATYADGKSDVQVFRGRITLAPAASGGNQSAPTPAELREGDSRRVGTDGVIAPIQLADATFVRPQQFASWTQAGKAAPFERWTAFSERARRDPSLVAYYTFENHDTTPNRLTNLSSAGAALDGLLGGGDPNAAPAWTMGRWSRKGALEFHSGQALYVSIPASSDLDFSRGDQTAAPFSIAMWVKGSGDADSAIVTHGRAAAEQYAVGVGPQQFRLWVRDRLPTVRRGTDFDLSGGSVADDRWHNLIATYDPANRSMSLYVDGKQSTTTNAPAKLLATSDEVRIGARQPLAGDAPLNFEGRVDEIAIYRRVLSPDDASAMYEAGRPE